MHPSTAKRQVARSYIPPENALDIIRTANDPTPLMPKHQAIAAEQRKSMRLVFVHMIECLVDKSSLPPALLRMPYCARPVTRVRSSWCSRILSGSRSRTRRWRASHISSHQVVSHVRNLHLSIPILSPGVLFTLHGSLLLCLVFAYALGQTSVAWVKAETMRWLLRTLAVDGMIVDSQ